MTLRWTPEEVAEFERRCEKWRKPGAVREHICKGPPPPPTPRRGHAERSRLENLMQAQLHEHEITDYKIEFQPLPPRKWKLDFAWPDVKIAIEVQGSVHRIKAKFKRDIEKRAELMLAGWEVLEVDGEAIQDGAALGWIKRLLGLK